MGAVDGLRLGRARNGMDGVSDSYSCLPFLCFSFWQNKKLINFLLPPPFFLRR